MEELFADIPNAIKEQVACLFDLAMRQHDIGRALNVLREYTDSCQTDYEKEFAEFYFHMRMEQILNENHTNKW